MSWKDQLFVVIVDVRYIHETHVVHEHVCGFVVSLCL